MVEEYGVWKCDICRDEFDNEWEAEDCYWSHEEVVE